MIKLLSRHSNSTLIIVACSLLVKCKCCILNWFWAWQRTRYEVGMRCVTLPTCPIHQGLIPQGEHLTKQCPLWVARQEVAVGWCPEGG